jgi:hypothetical protein
MLGQVGALMTFVYACSPVQLFASVAVTVAVDVPAAVGIPEMMPLLLSDIPAESEPAVILKVYGPVPPLAVIVLL